MKKLFLAIALLTFFSTAYAHESSETLPDLNQAANEIQKLLDEHGVECRFNLQPIRNLARIIFAGSVKLKGSCEGKDNVQVNTVVKLKFKENETIIKKLSITFKNMKIANPE
jgi:hypothetical protein